MLLSRCLGTGNLAVVLALLQATASQLLAPLDASPACQSRNASAAFPLLDTHQYVSLESLWFADDESIDLFQFPLPPDPVRWELVDQSECRNVWRYCGNSPDDILISQFIMDTSSDNPLVVSVDFAFFSQGDGTEPAEASDIDNVLIVEADDTTGQDNVHIEVILGNQSTISHDFVYSPTNQFFELVFRSNLTEETCLNISRVQVRNCVHPARDTSSPSMILCNRCPTGQGFDTEIEECFPCPAFSISSSRDQCVCEIGHQRSLPGQHTSPCDECTNGYFPGITGSCTKCPIPGFNNTGNTRNACKCFNESLTPADNCQFCAANYIRNSSLSTCILCPAGSRRDVVLSDSGDPDLEAEHLCTCLESSFTYSGENVTSYEACSRCAASLVWNGTRCVPCPENSQQHLPTDAICTCDSNTLTLAGQNETTSEPCFCKDNYFRPEGSTQCQRCPVDSSRSLRDPETSCPCMEGFTMKMNLQSRQCFTYIGFSINSLTFEEGDGLLVRTVTARLSRISETPFAVNISITTLTGDINVQVSPLFATLANTETLNFTLTHAGDVVALEQDTTLIISLLSSDDADLVTGGPGLSRELNIVIRDDDLLHVGFAQDKFEYSGSEQRGSVGVNISTPIARELVIVIGTNDSLLPPNYEVIFLPGGPTSMQVELNLSSDQILVIEMVILPSSLRDRVVVGGHPGLHRQLKVVRTTSIAAESALSLPAVIGIAVGVVVACLVAVVAMLVCITVTCCLKQRKSPKSKQTNTISAAFPEKPALEMMAQDLED